MELNESLIMAYIINSVANKKNTKQEDNCSQSCTTKQLARTIFLYKLKKKKKEKVENEEEQASP